ncbi:hypothetical protein [Nakamurella deserti]|uniref:hypothetical protein n=1 Tax=Nakamurella deserti TaxID=2164074 RepID=UPI000DBE7E46|nr:hypothetical protein [Nakamurella deserti]
MRRTVALWLVTLALAACSSSVSGRPGTDGAALPGGSSSAAVAPSPGRAAPSTPPATGDGNPDTAPGSGTAPGSDTAPGPGTTPGPDATPGPDTTPGPGTTTGPTATPGTDASNPATTTAGTAGTAATDAPAQLPTGFYAAGSDLGYRPMTTDEFDCTPDQASGCFGIMVFSVPGCPAGANVTVGIFDKSRDPVNALGTAVGTTPPIAPVGSQAVVIGDTTGVVADLTARVQQVVC